MESTTKRMLCLLLAVLMCLSLFPVSVFAEEGAEAAADPEPVLVEEGAGEELLPQEEDTLPEPEEPEAQEPAAEEPAGTPEAPAEEEPAGTPETPAQEEPAEPSEEPAEDPTEEPSEEPGEPAEGATDGDTEDAEEAEETGEEDAEDAEEDKEAQELPYGFKGMGEDYVLSEKELAAKQAIAGLPVTLASMAPGVDYVESELILRAESEDYARQAAEAYNAELVERLGSYALIRLREATVAQAVECAADPELPLPAAEPNWLSVHSEGYDSGGEEVFAQSERYDREDWLWMYGDSGLNPQYYDYQYHHDILGDYAVWGAATGEYQTIYILSDKGSVSELAKLSTASFGSGTVGVAPEANISYSYCSDLWDLNYQLSTYYYAIVLVDMTIPQTTSSITGSILNARVQEAVSNGCVVIAPMGDDGSNEMVYPAACDGVIAVAATDATGAVAPFSNTGAWCTISAPGVGLNGSYSGTSYAAALVAGAAALYQEGHPYDLTGFQAAMTKAATKGGAGAGVLNTANMFGGIPPAPKVTPYAYDLDDSRSPWLMSQDGSFTFSIPWASWSDYSDNADIWYTFDGSNPQFKDGHWVNGKKTYDGATISMPYDAEVGKTYTLKAITVNGFGIPSKMTQYQFKVIPSTEGSITVEVTGPYEIPAGNKTTMTAKATSSTGYDVEQSFSWEGVWVPYDDPYGTKPDGAKIDPKTGVVTSTKGRKGYLNITATHIQGQKGFWTLKIQSVNPVATAVIYETYLDPLKTKTISTSGTTLLYSYLEDKDAWPISSYDAGVVWSSSSEKVLEIVSSNPYCVEIRGVSPGKATLKAAVQDGSGKSATVSVTVTQGVYGLYVAPKKADTWAILPGGSLAFQATVYPTNATDKRITWEYSNPNSIPIDTNKLTKSGTLTVDKTYTPKLGDKITVRARSMENPSAYDESTVVVLPKASGLSVSKVYSANKTEWDATTTPATLKTVVLTLPNDKYCELYLSETYWMSGADQETHGEYATVTIANPKLATAYYDSSYGYWRISAYEAGTTKVTVTSACGTRKLSFNLKIITPISGIQLVSGAPGGTNTVAYGKSFKLKAGLVTAYGKPTDTKLNWRITSVYDSVGNWLDPDHYNWSSCVKINNGVLSVTMAAASIGSGGVARVEVGVEPANYYGPYGYFTVYVNEPIAELRDYNNVLDEKNTMKIYGYGYQNIDIETRAKDWYIPYNTQTENLLTATSSNPKLVSAVLDWTDPINGEFTFLIRCPNPDLLTTKPQTAKITVKANDGSNKSFSFTVQLSK